METIKKSNSQKNLFLIETNRKPTKGDLLLRHIWKNNPKLECKSWWRYKDTVTIDYLEQYTTLNGSFRDAVSSFKVQNIYIKSDEEIKEGDWIYSEARNTLFKVKAICVTSAGVILIEDDVIMPFEINQVDCKKIILTTDQELIKDGVQGIDDVFLNWFVENPSCEWVQVFSQNVYSMGKWDRRHKIIIPKEEPKQECLITKSMQMDAKIAYDLLPKQETLEEVALILYPENWESIMDGQHESNSYERNAFIKSAKWMQERSYSEEDIKIAFTEGHNSARLRGSYKFNGTFEEDFILWFENFKKK